MINSRMKAMAVALVGASLFVTGCSLEVDVASRNLAKAADQFEVQRRIVFYNGITDSYMLTIEGLCALGNQDGKAQRSVTCKTGPNEYKRHFLGLSDNVTYFAEQLQSANVSGYHYRVIFRPQTILPDIDLDVSGEALKDLVNGND